MTGGANHQTGLQLFTSDLELTKDNSIKDLPTPPMSTVSAQATKRATCGEHEVGLSWFSLRQRSKSTNSLEQPRLIFWITGLFSHENANIFSTLYLMTLNLGAL